MQKKSWYQVSLLQILVTMAVVAIFLKMNTSESKGPAKFGDVLYLAGVGDLIEVEYSKGWPLVYSTRRVLDPNEKVRKMTKDEQMLSGVHIFLSHEKLNTSWRSLVGNVIACVCVIVCSLIAVALVGKKVVIFGRRC